MPVDVKGSVGGWRVVDLDGEFMLETILESEKVGTMLVILEEKALLNGSLRAEGWITL